MVTSFYPLYHVGGACVHVYHLANELAKWGHSIHVLYSQDAYYIKRKVRPSSNSYPNHKNVHLHNLEKFFERAGPIFSFLTGYPASRKSQHLFDLIRYHNISLLGHCIFQLGTTRKICKCIFYRPLALKTVLSQYSKLLP